MITLYFRTIIIYFILLFTMRLMGKRQLGELRISELIVTLMISEIAVQPISDRNKPLLYAVIPMLLLLSAEVLVSYVTLKSPKIKKLLYGSSTMLIKRGKLCQKELKKNRIEVSELFSELRQKGYALLDEIYYVILEENGKLSVFPRSSDAPLTPSDVSLSPTEEGIDRLLIEDGKIDTEELAALGWDERRLDDEIKRAGIPIDEIFLMTANDSGRVSCIRRCGK